MSLMWCVCPWVMHIQLLQHQVGLHHNTQATKCTRAALRRADAAVQAQLTLCMEGTSHSWCLCAIMGAPRLPVAAVQ